MSHTLLITGASGFVGRQVVKQLLAKGQQLRLVVRPQSDLSWLPSNAPCQTLVTEDLFAATPTWWQAALAGVDTVVHLAWYAEPGQYLHSLKNLDCLAGTLTLARAALAAKVQRFVGVGTCLEYQPSARPLPADAPLAPASPYAAAKAACYYSLSQALAQTPMAFAWARLFYLFGEGEDERRLVPYLHRQLASGQPALLGSGQPVRDFMDVKDAGRQLATLSLASFEGATNICSGEGITIQRLAETIAKQYGRQDLLQFGARANAVAEAEHIVGVPYGASEE